MKPATARACDRDVRLLAIDECGRLSHHRGSDLASLLRSGDLVVANDAATLPASLHGTHLRSGEPIELRLAGHRSRLPRPGEGREFTAVAFGAGDYRTPTEQRPAPPALQRGDSIAFGSLKAIVIELHHHPRLVDVRFVQPSAAFWEGLARHGRPIQYAYIPEPLPIWDTWTRVAGRPVAFEAPSAGFVLDWAMLSAFRAHGVRFATLTLAAGISSTGDPELDRLLPFDEPYEIPVSTADAIAETRRRGGRIVAVGTTVVRALEAAASPDGWIAGGIGIARERVGPATDLRLVDAIVSGVHERESSHYGLLRAFQRGDSLDLMTSEAEAADFFAHEFGDLVLVWRDRECAGYSRANTSSPFAGITIDADAGNPCAGPPSANTCPPLPAAIGLTQLS
jgi:S-adenosylmethionine:tRNA ribosyltransferase-isomerase